MRRNCNLELQLYSPGSNETQQQEHQQQQRQLTIFYDGMMCVRDVTELQIHPFSCKQGNGGRGNSLFTPPSGSAEPPSPNVMSPLCRPVAGMSMKKSLQRFLQKRKHRTQATSPYHHYEWH